MQAVANRFTQAYFEDMKRLNVLEADAYPRATHTMNGIQRLIAELEQKGAAYAADGDVYFAVRQDADYGKLSGRKLDDLQAGASGRVAVTDPEEMRKKDPFDFALWKAAKPGEPYWESPWGPGRPGWHIECSAMVRDRLGDTIDIHVGGGDLIFPHHENEIAQSESATGKPLARYWMHNGMVNVGGEKMSKSLGNFTTIRALLDAPNAPDPMALRLFLLQAHYRKPVDFTDESIAAAQNGWHTLKEGLLFGDRFGAQLGWPSENPAVPVPESTWGQAFQAAMDDDFNTAGALAVLFDLAKELRKEGNLLAHQGRTEAAPDALYPQWRILVSLASVLGLKAEPEQAVVPAGLSDAEVETLIQQRQAARQAKNWAESDRIRHQLQEQGITLIDQAGGMTRWHRSEL